MRPKCSFEEKYVVDPETGCWLWTYATNACGYGTVGINGKTWLAHRYAYARRVGPIPEGMTLDHLCRKRSCVNPSHLEPVSHQVNMMRSRRTHCKYGHELIGGNVMVRTGGGRQCRPCTETYQAVWRRTHREENIEYQGRYRLEHHERLRAKDREYWHARGKYKDRERRERKRLASISP